MTLRPPRRPFSVSRQLSERARAAAPQEPPANSGFNIAGIDGVTGMLGALRGLVEQLAASAQQAGARDNPADAATGSFSVGGKGTRAVFGYTLRMGNDGISAEPFGTVPAPKTAANVTPAPLLPIVEVYQDGDTVVVIAELPGADPSQIVCRADGVQLLIEAAGARHYRKELTLPVPVRPDGIVPRIQNGILEVRLLRASAP